MSNCTICGSDARQEKRVEEVFRIDGQYVLVDRIPACDVQLAPLSFLVGPNSQLAQVVVTSHSADLLDNDAIPDSSILAALSEHAETRIGPLDEAGRSALRDHLFTAGELLRMDQLHPDPERSAPRQLDLFECAHNDPVAVTCLV